MVGDHIRARRGERWVHGIDCGDETILHVNDGPSGPRVARTYRPAFVGGAAEVEVVAHRERVFPAKMVVARAWSPIRDPALAAMFADSEAFARWCKTGRLPEAPANFAIAAAPGATPAPAAPARSAPGPAQAKAGPKAAKAAAARRSRPPAKAAARKAAPRRGEANAKAKAGTSAARKPARKAAGTRAATTRRPARRARRGGR
jgi:hypothetical protein